MISSWLTSWYQQNEQQQQESQLQEPFNDEYKTTDDWVEVITPSMKQAPEKDAPIKTWPEKTVDEVRNKVVQENKVISEYQAVEEEAPVKENKTTTVSKEVVEEDIFGGKKLSRQERRAKARFAAREIKKQARNAAMVINRNRGKGLAVSACLPAAPLAATN